jgi:predicted ester cyclase
MAPAAVLAFDGSMSLDAADLDTRRGEAVVRALVTGDVLRLQPLVRPDVVDHSATLDQPPGWAGLRERAMALCAAYPEPQVEVEVLCVDGDTDMCRVQLPGVPRGAVGLHPAGALILVFVLRFRDGLLAEMWTSTDVTLPATGRGVGSELADDASVA